MSLQQRYAKWDSFAVSDSDDDEDDKKQQPWPIPPSETPVRAPADAAAVVGHLAKVERLGEEVVAERAQMVDLDRRRNQNREALAALRRIDRQSGGASSAAQKHWMCMGDIFLKRPHATTRSMLEEEQTRIDGELESLRASVKRKTSTLCELDPSMCACRLLGAAPPLPFRT